MDWGGVAVFWKSGTGETIHNYCPQNSDSDGIGQWSNKISKNIVVV